jgi:hypothetical protein
MRYNLALDEITAFYVDGDDAITCDRDGEKYCLDISLIN